MVGKKFEEGDWDSLAKINNKELERIIKQAYLRYGFEYGLFKIEESEESNEDKFKKLLEYDTGYTIVPIIDQQHNSVQFEIRREKSLKELIEEFRQRPSVQGWEKVCERYFYLTSYLEKFREILSNYYTKGNNKE